PAHPFPFLSNLSLYLVVVPKNHDLTLDREIPNIGFVEVPSVIPRLIPVHAERADEARYVLLEDLIANNLASLFIGFPVEAAYTIRVTRNLDYTLLESQVVDLLKTIQKETLSREHQEVVRVEVDARLPDSVVNLIKVRIGLSDAEVYRVP